MTSAATCVKRRRHYLLLARRICAKSRLLDSVVRKLAYP
jgi:hypothetical protein